MKRHTTFSATLLIGCFILMGSQPLVAQEPRLRTTLVGHRTGVSGGFFSPDGKFLVTRAADNLLWDLVTEKSTKVGVSLSEPLFFSPDGNLLLLSKYRSSEIEIYDITRRKNSAPTMKPGESNHALSQDGRRQLVTNKNGLFLRELATPYDVTTGANDVALPGAIVPPREKDPLTVVGQGMGMDPYSVKGVPMYPMQFSADSKTLVVRDNDRNFMLWDVASSKCTTIPKSASLYFALSPDGKSMVARCGTRRPDTGFVSLDDNIQIFDLATGKSIASLHRDKNLGPVTTMIYSLDSKTIAAPSIYDVLLWDATNGSSTAVLHLEKPKKLIFGYLREVNFTPDSKTVVATVVNAVEFWDIASQKMIASLPIDGATCLAFSPDGATLATGGKDGKIRLWDMPVGKPADKK